MSNCLQSTIKELENDELEKFISNKELISFLFNEVYSQCLKALFLKEVPVGCVFYSLSLKKIVSYGHNLTNKNKNATSHAEINCIEELTIQYNNDFSDLILLVSCEPCIMCAYALCLLNIRCVFFGCYNEKFGGNGSVLTLNKKGNMIKGYQSFGGYEEEKFIKILQEFYSNGNESLPEEKRHRKKKLKSDDI